MYARIWNKHRTRELLPVNLIYAPYWIRKTWHTLKSQRSAFTEQRRGNNSRSSLISRANIDNALIILGAPRSGTTYLGDCISTLPDISYYFEPPITKAAVTHIYNNDWSQRKAKWIYRLTYSWLMRANRETNRVFCEKTPGNCFIVPFLANAFPQSRFIHIVRDGRDNALSLVKKGWYNKEMNGRYLRDPDGYLYGAGPRFWVESERREEYSSTSDFHRCLWLWRRYVEAGLAGTNQIDSDRVLQVHYEVLTTQPRETGERILDFLNISNPETRSQFIDLLSSSASNDSTLRWKTTLNDEDKATAITEAGTLLAKLGYLTTN